MMMYGMNVNAGRALLILLALLMLPAAVSADEYIGGIPLSTVERGTVSGGVFIDAYPGFATDATKTFTLPAGAEVRWAQLYVVVYCGNMRENYDGKVTVAIDGGGAGKREYTENLNLPYSFPGEGGTGPVALNDHCNRVTSDYLMWYDVASLLSSGTLKVHARTTKVSPSFDGRIKAIVLVAAYDDGDGDTVCYRVNAGHDTDSYEADDAGKSYVGETEFSTSELEDGFETASLSVLYLASADAEYRFNGDSLDGSKPSGAYFGKNTWEVGDSLQPGQHAALTYDRLDTETFYKVFCAVLSVRYPEEEAGSIAVSSSPAGATVYIDDEESGVTNTTITGVAVGDHQVRVEKEGYKTQDERTVAVKKGSTTEVSFALAPLTGSISVASEPHGAAILLDGSNTGKTTDVVIENVPVGSHTITLTLSGYGAYSAEVVVEEGSVAEVQAVLAPGGSSSDSSDGKEEAGGSGYAGGSLSVVRHVSINGNLSITSVSNYSGLMATGDTCRAVMDPGLPAGATVREARLYLFSTWAHDEGQRIGSEAQIALLVNGTQVQAGTRYGDRKGEGPYDYPVETLVYDVTSLVGRGNLTVTAANAGTGRTTFALYGSCLVLAYEAPDAPAREYWIAEGSDVVLAEESEAATTALFPDIPDPAGISGALFTVMGTAATGEEGQTNAVGFNGGEWRNVLRGGSSEISAAALDVLPYLMGGDNTAAIRSVPEGGKGDYIENRLAILVITHSVDADPVSSVRAGETVAAETGTAKTTTLQESVREETPEANTISSGSWFSSLWSWILSLFGIHSAADPGVPIADAFSTSEENPGAPVTTPTPIQPGDLLVVSEPDGALISLDGVYTGRTTPFVFSSLQPGDYAVGLEHENHAPFEATVVMREDTTISVDLSGGTHTLSPGLFETPGDETGSIYVTSKPDGATIVLDGRTLSYTTPQVICGLKPGLHTVKIKNGNGNFPIDSMKCYVTAGAVTPVSFVQDQVMVRSVTVTSESFKDLEFSMNGMRLNTRIPKRVDVPGISSFAAIRNATGYYSFMISDFLDDGEECNLGEPAPATAGVLVRSDPAGAAIFIDGFDTGFSTPYLIANISPGPHLVSVSRPGYIPRETRILLVEDSTVQKDAEISFVLEGYPYGSLTITSDPPGGKIYLYGKETGAVTPYTFTHMRIGRYEVKVTGQDGSVTRDDLVVLPCREAAYTFTFS